MGKSVMTYIDEIKHKAWLEGVEEGREEGREEARKEAREKGREEIRTIARKHIERLVLSALTPEDGKKMSIKKVAEIFQLSVYEVRKIRDRLSSGLPNN
jgi:hypothetical protein